MIWDDWVVDTNAQMTILQVIPVFLVAALVDVVAISRTSERAPRWVRVISVLNTAALLALIGYAELDGLVRLGQGKTYRGWEATPWITNTGAVMFLAFVSVAMGAWSRGLKNRRARDREKAEALKARRRKLSSRASRSR